MPQRRPHILPRQMLQSEHSINDRLEDLCIWCPDYGIDVEHLRMLVHYPRPGEHVLCVLRLFDAIADLDWDKGARFVARAGLAEGAVVPEAAVAEEDFVPMSQGAKSQ